MSDDRGTRGDAGFTLIEAVISIGLLALLLTMLPTALHLGRSAFEAGRMVDGREQAIAWRSLLEARLSSALDLQVRSAQGTYGKAFSGGPTSIEFVAEDAEGPTVGGLYRYRFGLDGDNKVTFTQQLFHRNARPDQGGEEPIVPLPWSIPVSSLRIRYFDPGRGNEQPAWKDEWTRFDAMPRLIQIDIVSQSRSWPLGSITVEPKLR